MNKNKPEWPLNTFEREGYTGIKCPACGSSFPRKYVFFGARRCINYKCKNHTTTHRAPTLRSTVISTNTQILDELRKMNEVLGRLDKCMSDQNHKNQMCIKTGHWND